MAASVLGLPLASSTAWDGLILIAFSCFLFPALSPACLLCLFFLLVHFVHSVGVLQKKKRSRVCDGGARAVARKFWLRAAMATAEQQTSFRGFFHGTSECSGSN